jgi:2-amino-4-hydroxy-6-hydroxymethyldihydropteridine diphosphokinase
MKTEQFIVLSLGSNQGDREKNLTNAIELINQKIGLVTQVSQLYESESWGFTSTPFYNCAIVVNSCLALENILLKIEQIEKKLGRILKNTQNYEDRLIDIDIICVENTIIKTATLTIPHPYLQDRKFVLLPLQDLKLDWKHPILEKNITELVKICPDNSNCIAIKKLESPYLKYKINQLNYLAIEGNIGAGKTTLSNKLASDFNAKLVLERFADNPFLPKFYKDQNRYAFPLEMSFLADRYKQLTNDLSQFDLFKEFVVADYNIFKSLIFAKVTLQEDEFRLYKTMFDIIYKEMPKPDLYVYLYQNTERLLQNIKKRGRNYEQDITPDYLEKINQGYLEYIKSQKNLKVLIIDVSYLDFVQEQIDYLSILNLINESIF